jgi:cystathionine beta-lyase
MNYDFDRVIERRNTNCIKWDAAEEVFGSSNILPMWIADMDFSIPHPITEALQKRIEHGIYGYSRPSHPLIEAVVSRMWKNYGWKIDPEWIVFTPGVIPALNVGIRAFSNPGDEVIIQSPVYYPFWRIIKNSGRQVVSNNLQLTNGHFQMDYTDLSKIFDPKDEMMPAPSHIKLMILCSPHNPVGRVWTKKRIDQSG